MIGSPLEVGQEDNNPLDMIEDLVASKGWKFHREDDEFLMIELQGQKEVFEVCLEWQEEFSALLMTCSLPIKISPAHHEIAVRTLEQINQNLWLGHFDLSGRDGSPALRHTLLMRMIPAGLAVDLVHDLLDLTLAECNRFYTTFQLVQAGDVALQDNISAAVFETVGEA